MSHVGRLVIGIGNAWRRDDSAGLVVAERLAEAAPRGVEVRRLDGEGSRLLDLWDGFDDVTLVDAASSGADPGTLHRLGTVPPLPPALCRSTHAFGIPEALALARALGRLPSRLVVYGIEGGEFGAGDALSPAVRRAVDRLAAELAAGTA